MRVLILLLLLAGCSSESSNRQPEVPPPTRDQSILYGDSRCVHNKYVTSKDCESGRALIHLDHLDTSYRQVFIHLGYNDMNKVSAWVWGRHLQYLIRGIEYRVWCILPTWANPTHSTRQISSYRDAMLDICTHTLDPQIEGYLSDGVHYTDGNYYHLFQVLESVKF